MSELALRLIEENKRTKNKFLDLGKCGLKNELPEELLDCVWLKRLNLGSHYYDSRNNEWISSKNNNSFNKFNGQELVILKNLIQLDSLYLSNNQIQDISFLQNLPKLEFLDLFDNQIKSYSSLENLKQLQLLDIRSNPIEDYSFLEYHIYLRILAITVKKSDDIILLKKLTQLQSLHIDSIQNKDFGFLAGFPHLKYLNLSFNNLIDCSFLKSLTQLESLDLSYNQIQDISFLKKLNKLQNLNLWKNQISNISYLEDLNQLQTLNLGSNKVQDISSLKNLNKLKNLKLFSNQIVDISFLKNKIQLQSLDLSSNEIIDASFLESLTTLSFLNLFSNKIRDISFVENLTQLQHFELSFNDTEDVSYLKNLTKLQYLDLQYNHITDISFLEKLIHLQTLNLSHNKIQNVSFLKKFIKLQTLKINHIGIQDISFLYKFTQLQTLEISHNQIQDISFLYNLKQLQTLEVGNNQIQDISFLYKLTQLKTLEISNNRIQYISSLSNLKQLQTLELSSNQIQDYTCLKELVLLKSLGIRNNQIKNISFLENLTQLEHLDIRNNRINSIKPLLTLLKKNLKIDLKTEYESYHRRKDGLIFLKNNLINEPSFEILEQGNEKIIEYFEGKRKPLNECKLIFVGDGKVGKTSLMRRLIFNEFNPEEPTTHGINKIAWKDIKNEKGEEIKINLWDFGGQHIQHSLHQFFFSQRVVYVLVLEPRNDQKANYWLEQIDKLGRDSEILVVYNWKDSRDKQAEYKSNFYELRKTYPKLKEPFLLSCKTGEGTSKFKIALQEAILANEELKVEYREEWFNIKSRLERDVPIGTNYIEYDTYQQWCNEENYTDPDRQRSLLKILDSIGSMVFFDKPVLKEYQILNPDWVTTGAYSILTASKTMTNKGHLSWEDLKEIFKEEKEIFANEKIKIKYTEKQFHFIIQLMLNYDLCQENPFKRHEFLIPSAFDDTLNRDYENEKINARQYRIQFDAPFEMLLIHRFIAKNIIRITGKDYWNSGIYIKHPSSKTFALVETSLYSNQINCWIKGDNIRGLWELIRNDFREIFNDYHNFKPSELVEYNSNEKSVFLDYEEMLDALRNGKKIIDYDLKHRIGNIDVLAVLDLFEDKNETQKNMENEKKGDTYNFNAPISGGIGGIGSNSQNTLNKDTNNKPEQKKEESKEDKIAEDKAVRKWKMAAIWSFIIALLITIPILYIYTNEPETLMKKEEWTKFKGSFLNVISSLAFTGGWIYFIYKMLYERLLDSSKEKSFRDLWKSKSK